MKRIIQFNSAELDENDIPKKSVMYELVEKDATWLPNEVIRNGNFSYIVNKSLCVATCLISYPDNGMNLEVMGVGRENCAIRPVGTKTSMENAIAALKERHSDLIFNEGD